MAVSARDLPGVTLVAGRTGYVLLHRQSVGVCGRGSAGPRGKLLCPPVIRRPLWLDLISGEMKAGGSPGVSVTG